MKKPILAITMGDPSGIGPEIIAKAIHRDLPCERYQPLIIGSEQALNRAFNFTNCMFPYTVKTENEFHQTRSISDDILLINDEFYFNDEIPLAKVDSNCGASAYRWLLLAIEMAVKKQVAAIVTAPLHKEALNLAGYHYAGHTEILAEKTQTDDFSLMLIAGQFRVTHVTCHMALKDVSQYLSKERIAMVIRLFNHALVRLDGKRPRIAVCAFNPHAGEGGLFGVEEIQAIRPAVELWQKQEILVDGPFPSDSIYPQLIGGRWDGVIAMYHDQGHIPFKLSHFHFDRDKKEWSTVTGVNVTLGLPIIRTSVDHGTAFDLAGTGKASEQSLLDAIDVALKLID